MEDPSASDCMCSLLGSRGCVAFAVVDEAPCSIGRAWDVSVGATHIRERSSADTATVCALSPMCDTHPEPPPVRGLYPPAMGRNRRAP